MTTEPCNCGCNQQQENEPTEACTCGCGAEEKSSK